MDPKVKLAGDLPGLDSSEFAEFLADWHAEHNGQGRQPKKIKTGLQPASVKVPENKTDKIKGSP